MVSNLKNPYLVVNNKFHTRYGANRLTGANFYSIIQDRISSFFYLKGGKNDHIEKRSQQSQQDPKQPKFFQKGKERGSQRSFPGKEAEEGQIEPAHG